MISPGIRIATMPKADHKIDQRSRRRGNYRIPFLGSRVCFASAFAALAYLHPTFALSPGGVIEDIDREKCRPFSQASGLDRVDRFVNDRVFQISRSIDTPPNFVLCPADSDLIAYATTIEGEKAIVYDKATFFGAQISDDDAWGASFILAHEMGHHLLGHDHPSHSSIFREELEADAFAGFALSKMGASRYEVLHVLKQTSSTGPTLERPIYPTTDQRIEAASSGWNKAYLNKSLHSSLSWLNRVQILFTPAVSGIWSIVSILATIGGAVGAVFGLSVWLSKSQIR